MDEFETEMAQLMESGIKSSPLRLTYEAEVRALSSMADQLRAEGYCILVNLEFHKGLEGTEEQDADIVTEEEKHRQHEEIHLNNTGFRSRHPEKTQK